MKRLYEIPRDSKIYEEVVVNGSILKDSYVIFRNIDGGYSRCEAYDKFHNQLMEEGDPAIVHMQASTPLVKHKDGYKITSSKDKR